MGKNLLLNFVVIAACGLACAISSTAQDQPIKTSFVHLGPGVPGALYEPVTPGEKSQIAVFVMHSGADYLNHSACTELSKRGYRVLCANNTSNKGGSVDDGNMDRLLLDAKYGVAYLRKVPGVKKVVLLGHSGGGSLMSSYQYIAENGVKACQAPEVILKCSDRLAGLPPADGIMLIDSNWGLSTMTLFSVDPAVVSENNGAHLNPDLDLFNPKNGFNPAGSDYSPEFIHKWETAEGQRMNQLIQTALDRLAAIQAGNGPYNDDDAFTIPGANFRVNLLFPEDVKLMSHTQKAWPLLHADGSITTGIIHTVRVPESGRMTGMGAGGENTSSQTRSFETGALKTTLRNFLTTYAIRVGSDYSYDADTVRGVDWKSSYSATPGNVQGITVPTLVMGMTGHWEYLSAETIYENARSTDKSIAFVEGATHGYTTCKQCEKFPGQFGDTQTTTYNFADAWLSKPGRFLQGGQ
jgi:hypothetical protein